MEPDQPPPGFTVKSQDNNLVNDIVETSENNITFSVDDKGTPVQVSVAMNYPFYDVVVANTQRAQLEQDLHSNWFKTSGHIDDHLVQQIGRKISLFITGV